MSIVTFFLYATLATTLHPENHSEFLVKYCGPQASGAYKTAFTAAAANSPETLVSFVTAGNASDVCPQIAQKIVLGRVTIKCVSEQQSAQTCRRIKVFEIHSIKQAH